MTSGGLNVLHMHVRKVLESNAIQAEGELLPCRAGFREERAI